MKCPFFELASHANRATMIRQIGSRVATAVVLCVASFWFVGCGVDCYGDDCGCDGDRECIISCSRSDCDLFCARASQSCGAICGDRCEFECHDTNHCSAFSGNDSRIDCHNVSSCAAECGADCEYDARDVDSVEITVGPGSSVHCSRMSRCEVTCEGPCEVQCDGSVSDCELDCEDGTSPDGSWPNRSCQ